MAPAASVTRRSIITVASAVAATAAAWNPMLLFAHCTGRFPERSISSHCIDDLTACFDQKDPALLTALDEIVLYLSIGLSNVVNAYQPRKSISEADPTLSDRGKPDADPPFGGSHRAGCIPSGSSDRASRTRDLLCAVWMYRGCEKPDITIRFLKT